MRLRQRLTVRWQLMLLVLALALPFLVFLLISAERQSKHGRDEAGQRMLGTARVTAARLDDHVGDILQVLSVLTSTVGCTAADQARNDAALRTLSSHLPTQIHNISVWSAEGRNVGSLQPAVYGTDADASRRKYFIEALKGLIFGLEAPAVSHPEGERILVFSMGVHHGDSIVGVVAASVQLKQLEALLAPPATLPEGAVVTVSDEHGMVLARSLDPEKWIGRNLRQGLDGASLNNREGVRDGPSIDGINRIGGVAVTRRVPWLVYVGIPTNEALAPVRARLYENIAAGGVMFIIGLLLALWVGRRISRPLAELESDAAALARGNLSHRTQVRAGGEVGTLAATLNRMADSLQQHTASLQASEQRMRQMAETDALTGLPNRALFMLRLEAAIAQRKNDAAPLAVLFLDVDGFKTVNDTLGHLAGDEVLATFAQGLQSAVRSSDTVARLSGDEFTILMDAPGGTADALRVAEDLLSGARRRVGTEVMGVSVSASIGIAMLQPGDDAPSLLRRADEALYAAKRAGRDRVALAPVA